MKKMLIFEPAMCCPTGLCGVGVDPELLRISTVLSNLEKNGVVVKRYNLTNNPQEFVNHVEINKLLMEKGVEALPVTVIDEQIIKTAKYPTNDEFITWLEVPRNNLGEESAKGKDFNILKKDSCGCGDGCC